MVNTKKSIKKWNQSDKAKACREKYLNKPGIRKRRAKQCKDWREKNREHVRNYRRTRLHKDDEFRISEYLRNRVRIAIKEYTLSGKTMKSKHYGIDYAAIIEHLKPFPEDTSKYHIDHIKPLCSFNLEDPEEVKKAFLPENHQWLLAEENNAKVAEDRKVSIRPTMFNSYLK